jgi:hypothetical protein
VLQRADDVVQTPQFLNVIGTEFAVLGRGRAAHDRVG